MELTKEAVIKAFANDSQLADVLNTEKLNVFAELAVKGVEIDPKHAMRLMIDGYIDNCGISAGVRTIYYDAGAGVFREIHQNRRSSRRETSR